MVLIAAEHALAPGGRLVIVSFHSLEDRAVKSFLTLRCGRQPEMSRHLPAAGSPHAPSFELISRKPITPGPEEVDANPRARSAKLRAARRTGAPAWPDEPLPVSADARGLQADRPVGRRPSGIRRPMSPS
jgi:16S rRNA (cytosine1402-N4)-methyltransferase